MDFLRRLHPGRGQEVGAARLDVAPRWSALAEEAPADDKPLPQTSMPAVGDTRPPRSAPAKTPPEPTRSPARTFTTPAMPPVPPKVAIAGRDPAVGAEPTARADAALDTPAPSTAAPMSASSVQALPSTAPRVAAERPTPAPRSSPAAPAITPRAPLRAEALPPARAETAASPRFVQVTIDRIDVRLPPAPAAPPLRERRPRPASTVTPLADYLRAVPPRGGGKP